MTSRRFQLQLAAVVIGAVGVSFGLVWWLGLGTTAVSVALVLAALLAFGASHWLSRPMRRLLQAAEALDEVGQERGTGDEVDQLVRRFVATRRRLDEHLETITQDRNQLTAILGSMVEGVLAVDAAERVVHVNRVAVDLLGLNGSDGLGMPLGRPVHEMTRQRQVLEALTEALEHNRVVHSMLSIGDGADERHIELSATPLRNGTTGAVGAVVVLHDVTRLQALEGIRRDFVSNVSHELKTPLTAIRGFVETMESAPDLDVETRQRFLERISSQTARLSSLVSDLLSLSRIESTAESPVTVVDLRMPVMESLRSLRPVVEERQIDLSYELPERAVERTGDAEAFRQAFSNLIDNALKYTPEHGRVWVALRAAEGQIVFEVRDEGPGIDEKHLPRVFERFYRADKARSRELGGTGLGLSIVKNVALNSGGNVEVESRRGDGSTFRMIWKIEPAVSGDRRVGGAQNGAANHRVS